MPRLTKSAPRYRHHKSSGLAVVTLDGRDFYLGKYGTKASRSEYDRLTGEWMAGGRRLAGDGLTFRLTVTEILAAFWAFAERYYVDRDGKTTKELECYRAVMRPLKEIYGAKPAAEFGPVSLKVVRQRLIDARLARTNINHQVTRIRRIFKWAVENELVTPSVLHGLQAVAGLRFGKCEARETEPIKTVPDPHVDAIRPFVSVQVWAMVQLQRLTAMRSGEVVSMRGSDINMAGAVWVYSPADHKTSWRGHVRRAYLGPRAQDTVRPFLRTDLQAFLFSPAEAETARRLELRQKRKSPMTPSQERRRAKKRPKRPKGDHYTVASYRRAIEYGIKKAGVPHWHPHQLRHNAATLFRRDHGLEAARVLLGHKSAAITEVYAEVDHARAVEVMAKIG